MAKLNPLIIKPFPSSKSLAIWLEANHGTETEIWVKIFKKASGIKSVTWDDVVIECLCWGWIDSIKKSIDEQAYLQRITPRRPRSSWSKRNRDHAERLIREGRMTASGLAQIQAAKADGRWDNAYATREMEVPGDFIEALGGEPKAKAFFDTLNKSNRFIIANGLISAKKSETRQRRFDTYMGMLLREEKPAQ